MAILIIFILFVVAVVVLLEIRERRKQKSGGDNVVAPTPSPDPNCCGAHLVCERDSMLNPSTDIIYYDDEELDAFKGIASDAYSDEQVDQFADVFYTLKESDVVGWLKSLQLRGIELPDQLHDEALLIVREQRQKH